MRVYIPATLSMLERFVGDGVFQPLSGTAFAVTPALREAYSQGDDDQLGEVAIAEAALASLRLLASEPESRPRRAVLIVDADATPRPDLDDAVVRIDGRVNMDQVAAVYVDNAEAEGAVRAAVAVIDDADLGDEDAELTVGDAQDHDLAWYDRTELPFLIERL